MEIEIIVKMQTGGDRIRSRSQDWGGGGEERCGEAAADFDPENAEAVCNPLLDVEDEEWDPEIPFPIPSMAAQC